MIRKIGKDLELLDSPGILPMRISDQLAAIKLVICDDIGEKSYDVDDVAAILVQMLTKLPTVGRDTLCKRYKFHVDCECGKIFVEKLALHLFNGDVHQAAYRILSDFRKGRFGWTALERPPRWCQMFAFRSNTLKLELKIMLEISRSRPKNSSSHSHMLMIN